jgi:hypothetical protein
LEVNEGNVGLVKDLTVVRFVGWALCEDGVRGCFWGWEFGADISTVR